ncbi:MAG TPA: putative metal-binding protein [Terriglobia bacterium]|nr:putative metal-binding protein [Terriglobia bacterium]
MRIDPAITRLKYDRELDQLASQRQLLESRGIFILTSSRYPEIDFLLVPKHPLRVIVPVIQQGGILLPPGTGRIEEVLNLSARAFRARFDLTDYDLRAPSLTFLDPWTDAVLKYEAMFRAFEYEKERKVHLVLLDAHPDTRKPFLCLRGVREYHEHPQHSGDEWFLYRGSVNVFSILLSLWRASLDLVHAHLMILSDRIQVQWTAEEKL